MSTIEPRATATLFLVPAGGATGGLRAALRAARFRLVEPAELGEALSLVAEVAADAIVVEAGDGGEAEEALRAVAADRLASQAPVVVLAPPGLAPARALEMYALGALDVALPPHDAALLAGRLRAVVRYKRRLDAARELSVRDELTGLYNRRFFLERLDQEVARARRARHGIALLLLDVDRFKKINDTFGHPTGDAVLAGVAAVARRFTRRSDLVARVGGDEFAVLLSANDAAGARTCALALQRRLREARLELPADLKVTLSIGVAAWPSPLVADPLADLVPVADQALLRAKEWGRDLVVVAGEDDAPEAGPAPR